MKKIIIIVTALVSTSLFACKQTVLHLKSINPVNGEDFSLHIRAFVPKGDSDRQVIILPPIGGVSLLEGKYANKICNRGTSAFVFVNWTDDMEASVEDLSVHNRGTLRGLHAVETFLKYSEKPSSILGTSLGGIYAGVAVGKFDLIDKAAIIASGTNLSQLMATTTLPELSQLRKKRFEYFGFQSNDEYAQAIKTYLTVEAINFKDNYANKKLLFFKTNSDTVIRPKYQDELINLFDPNNTRVVRTRFGHKPGIIYTYGRRSSWIANFLSRP